MNQFAESHDCLKDVEMQKSLPDTGEAKTKMLAEKTNAKVGQESIAQSVPKISSPLRAVLPVQSQHMDVTEASVMSQGPDLPSQAQVLAPAPLSKVWRPAETARAENAGRPLVRSVQSLDLKELGVDSLPSIWTLENLPGEQQLHLPSVCEPGKFVVDGHLKFDCSPQILKACSANFWTFGKEEIQDLPAPSDMPTLAMPEDLAHVLQGDAMSFVKVSAPWCSDEGNIDDLKKLVAETSEVCMEPGQPELKYQWDECSRSLAPLPETARISGDETWVKHNTGRCTVAFQEQGLDTHLSLLGDVPDECQAVSVGASLPKAADETCHYKPSPEEGMLTQQLETGSNFAWVAYRQKLPQLIPPLGGVEEPLPDLEKLQELLKKHEARLELKEKPLKAHDFGDDESKALELSLYRLLCSLHVILLLREDLKKNGVLHAIFNAMSAVAPKAKQTQFLSQIPVLVTAMMSCHDLLSSVPVQNLTAPSAIPREANGVDAGKARDLCEFVNCPGCQISGATVPMLRSLELPRIEGLKVLRRKAIEQNKRLVVLFASQSVLEAIAMTIGADLSGKAPREVVAVSATTPPSKCEAMLRSSATALIHESILSFAAAQHSSEIVAAWEVRRLLKQSLVVGYECLTLESSRVLLHFRLESERRDPDPGSACSESQKRGCELSAVQPVSPQKGSYCDARAVADPLLDPPLELAHMPHMPEGKGTLIVGAHLLEQQDLLRGLEAGGLQIVEREVLAETEPDLLLGPRVCCFLRSAHVISRQRRNLCDRIAAALSVFEEVILILVMETQSPQEQELCEGLLQALRAQGSNSLRASTVQSQGLVQLLLQETLSTFASGRGFLCQLEETERDELPILAALPGLNVALAEDLLSQMSFAQVLQKGAVAVADALGLQLPEHIIRKLQDAIIAKRPAAAAAGPERRLYGFAGRDAHFFETQQFQPGKRRAGEDLDREIQTPPAQRCPAVVNCDRELLLTPPNRIMAPARHARQVTPAGDKDHVRCIFPEAQEIATKRYPQQSHGMREEDLQRSRYEKDEKHLRVPNSIPSLPQKRLYSQDLERAEQEHFRSLEFANSHQKYHLNQNQPLNSRAGLRGVLVNRPALTRGSLFGSLSGDSRPLNSNFRRPAGFRNWMG